jgi:tRNA 2-thiouridine synthesizing protein A
MIDYDLDWDAGDLACGDLVLELRRRVRAAPGKVFRVTALDPGAPEDIPAWCAMTGHALLAHDRAAHAFFIRAKD